MTKVSIRASVLTVILTLVGVISSSLLISQYYFSQQLAIESTHNTFKLISRNITKDLKSQGHSVRKILIRKKENTAFLEPISLVKEHSVLAELIQVLQAAPGIYAIYFAQVDGHFYEVINKHNKRQVLQAYNAPSETSWVVIKSFNNQQKRVFLNDELQVIDTKKITKNYDPRRRPWYLKAIESESVIRTKPYLFSNLNEFGFTFATRLKNKSGVLAIDYTMTQLNQTLALQKINKNSEVFVVNAAGEKLASSNFIKNEANNLEINSEKIQAINSALLQNVLDEKIEHIVQYSEAGKNYFSMVLPLFGENTYLGVKLDADKLFEPYIEKITHSFLIAFALLLLALPFIFLSTNLIIKPIKALLIENEKIKNRKFTEVKHIKTRITEFDDLSESLLSMSQSIQAYEIKQEELLNSIIKLIAEAIDAKSAYTGGHCERVPAIAQLLLDEANKSDQGVFKDFTFNSKEELREFEIGAWLHDCGKVATPEYVVDKSTKLETIYNRIHEVRMRFEVLWRDAEISYLKQTISEQELKNHQDSLRDDFEFLASTNMGGEFMDADKQQRVQSIANKEWQRHFDDRLGLGEVEALRYEEQENTNLPATEKLLSNKIEHIVKRENFDPTVYEKEGFKLEVPEHLYNYGEIHNLCIERGTLSDEERYKINEHVILSIKMLEKIPFPEHLQSIPEYAGTHHETLIGTGYPRKLTKEELSIPARIMAVADIFEALTASDRPYKKAKTLSTSIKIMSFMVKDQHIDADLFKLFLTSGVYKDYAQKFLKPEQIDEVDVESYFNS